MPFDIHSFAESCIRGEYVLVVGSECVLRKEEGDAQLKAFGGNSDRMLYKMTAAHLIDDEEDLNEKFRQYTDFEPLGRKLQSASLHEAVEWVFKNRFFGNQPLTTDLAEPTLRDLIATRCFRVVVTTTIDPYVLWLMEDVWGKGNVRVCNICDTDSLGPSLGNYEYNEFHDVPPTLYYAFGTIHPGSTSQSLYHLTDDDALRIIVELYKQSHEERSNMNELTNYITPMGRGTQRPKPRQLFCVGCDFDNWLFRFFMYVLCGENMTSHESEGGVVAMTWNENTKLQVYLKEREVHIETWNENAKLQVYLEKRNVHTEIDSRKFMRTLVETINEKHPLSEAGDIFISYAHEDWVEASQLYQLLKDKGCQVWIDDKRLGRDGKGTDYDHRIEKAIGQSNVFISVLSDQTRRDLETLPGKVADIDFSMFHDQWPKGARYYMKEWNFAQKEKKQKGDSFVVIPFTIHGYECGDNYYHNKTLGVLPGATQFSANDRDCMSRIMKEIDGVHERNNTRQQ